MLSRRFYFVLGIIYVILSIINFFDIVRKIPYILAHYTLIGAVIEILALLAMILCAILLIFVGRGKVNPNKFMQCIVIVQAIMLSLYFLISAIIFAPFAISHYFIQHGLTVSKIMALFYLSTIVNILFIIGYFVSYSKNSR